MEKAIFGAGCFWGVEDVYRQIKGIISTTVGYAGGYAANPSYAEVCAGETGHTEVVEIEYDPSQVTYEDLLDIFFDNHDPTSNKGEQYKSVIFYFSKEQMIAAQQTTDKLKVSRKSQRPIRTEIKAAGKFYKAEEYHQQYYEKQRNKIMELRAKCDID
jgi:peptide-methionine (S)-S-oxide reductase